MLVRIFSYFFFAILTSACTAVTQSSQVRHGFHIKNVGKSNVSDIEISYGSFYQKSCSSSCSPKYASFWGVNMPLQESAVIRWKTSDGKSIESQVPVRSKIIDASRLAEIMLSFDGAHLEVAQSMSKKGLGEVGLDVVVYYKND